MFPDRSAVREAIEAAIVSTNLPSISAAECYSDLPTDTIAIRATVEIAFNTTLTAAKSTANNATISIPYNPTVSTAEFTADKPT